MIEPQVELHCKDFVCEHVPVTNMRLRGLYMVAVLGFVCLCLAGVELEVIITGSLILPVKERASLKAQGRQKQTFYSTIGTTIHLLLENMDEV